METSEDEFFDAFESDEEKPQEQIVWKSLTPNI